MPYLLKDLWLSFFVIWISYECSVLVGYAGIKLWFFDRFTKKFKNDYRFKMIKESVNYRPILSSCLVWFIIIPDIVKMICLILAEIPFWTYFLSSVPIYALQSFMYSLVGVTLKNFSDTALSDGGWSHMTAMQKVQFIVTISLMILSFIVIFGWGLYIRNKLRKYK